MQRQEKQQVYICTRYKFEPHPKNSYDFSCAIYDDKGATVGHFKKMIKTILVHLMLFIDKSAREVEVCSLQIK